MPISVQLFEINILWFDYKLKLRVESCCHEVAKFE